MSWWGSGSCMLEKWVSDLPSRETPLTAVNCPPVPEEYTHANGESDHLDIYAIPGVMLKKRWNRQDKKSLALQPRDGSDPDPGGCGLSLCSTDSCNTVNGPLSYQQGNDLDHSDRQ